MPPGNAAVSWALLLVPILRCLDRPGRKVGMSKRAILLAVSAGLLFLSAPALAADIDVQRNEPALVNGVLYPFSGKPLVLPDMESILAALPTPRSEVNAIANIGTGTTVHVIVLDMMIDANAAAIADARTESRQDIERLQSAIAANAAFRSELESKNVTVETVIAAALGVDGSLILYVLA
jgi:hypothetical protein